MPLLPRDMSAIAYAVETATFAVDAIRAINDSNDSKAGVAEESARRLAALPDFLRSAFPDFAVWEKSARVLIALGLDDSAKVSAHSAYADYRVSVDADDWRAAVALANRLNPMLSHRSTKYGLSVAPADRWPEKSGRSPFGDKGQAVNSWVRTNHIMREVCLHLYSRVSDTEIAEVVIRVKRTDIRVTFNAQTVMGGTRYSNFRLVGADLGGYPMHVFGWSDNGNTVPDGYAF